VSPQARSTHALCRSYLQALPLTDASGVSRPPGASREPVACSSLEQRELRASGPLLYFVQCPCFLHFFLLLAVGSRFVCRWFWKQP